MRRALIVLVLFLIVPTAFAQSADQDIFSVVDSPDPVTPGNNVTYTIQIRNNGPDAAVNGGINASFQQNVNYQSAIVPAGWSCSQFGQQVSCTTPSFTSGASVTITMIVQLAAHLANFPDGSFTSNFSTSGVTPDPNNGNNFVAVTTNWDSPQIDLALTVADSPDPVTPNNDVTYTVPVTNNGPDTATALSFNAFNNGSMKFQSANVPAGWNCTLPAVNAAPTFTCTSPSMASGATSIFTVVTRADPAILGVNDGSVQQNFSVNGTGDDTNDPNNSETETTGYVTPDANLSIAVSDSPDPVTPNNNITYTVTVMNNGPDTATNASMSAFNNGSLQFQSANVPVGWNCTLPAVNAAPSFTCTNPSFANGASAVFTVVVKANPQILGINDGTVSTNFNISSGVSDPNNGNNSETEDTAYVTPDADMTVSVTDSPDPVAPDNNITYTVTVTNNGPDTATNATLNAFNNGSLQFQSANVPAGWNCTLPAVNAAPAFTCTNPSFANGGSSIFTVVVRASLQVLGAGDTTVSTNFNVSSGASDPNNGNNSETEDTAYVTPDANLAITASDSPDPVVNGANLTYTINVTNNGPDTAANAQLSMSTHPSLQFQSLNAAAGWSCTTPAVGTSGPISCTNPSLANGANATFTLVEKLVTGGANGTISSVFSTSSATQDPVISNNSVEVFTNWIGQSNLTITKSTLSNAVAQGGTLVYTISTSNLGPSDASNVTVTDVLPASLRFQSINAPAGWSCTTPAVGANGTVSCTIATLTNGTTANFTLTTTIAPNATGSISNNASIGGSGTGTTSGAAGAVLIGGNANLGVTKSTNATAVVPGGSLSYTISVTNAGPDPAASVVMTDVLPSSLIFQSINAPAGWTCNGTTTITCSTPTLASGATATFTLNVTVAQNATGTISNSASATHSGTDSAGGNNSGTTPPLPVTPVPEQTEQIPTLSEWALIGFVILLGGLAMRKMA